MAQDLDAVLLMLLVSMSRADGARVVDVIEALLDGAGEELGRDPTRTEVEDSVARLIGAGYVRADGDRVVPSESGEALVRSSRRLAPESRLRRIREALEDAPPTTPGSWVLPGETWDQGRLAARERHGRRTADRLHIVEGLLRALDLAEDIIRVSRGSVDPDAIRLALAREPFGFSEIQANHVLDAPVRSFSEETRASLEAEAERLRREH